MKRTLSHEERALDECADAARAHLRRDVRALERCADRNLAALGAVRHPFAAVGVAAAAGVLLGRLGGHHAGTALRRGGSAAISALRWSSLLA